MNSDQVAVATMTLARSPEEERQLREALSALKKTGLTVFVSDGGSPPGFVQFVHDLGFHLLQPTAKGLVPQITLSIKEAASASGKPFIFYTEPDKTEFFSSYLPAYLKDLQPSEKFGCELIGRTVEGFATFPAMQQYVETVINKLSEDLLGVAGDYTYGPFLFRTEFAPETYNLNTEVGWGWRFHLFARIVAKGYRLSFKELPVSCPVSQRGENDRTSRIYRMKQLKQNIDGLLGGLAS